MTYLNFKAWYLFLAAFVLLAVASPAAAQLNLPGAINWGRQGGGLSGLSFSALALSIVNALFSVILAFAIVAIVVGGIMYVLSLGNENRTSRAKGIIMAAIIGLFVAGTPYLVLQTVCNVLQIQSAGCQALAPPAQWADIANNISNLLIQLMVTLAFGAVIWGGVMYITALGNESQVARAKSIIIGAVIGLAIVGMYQIIVYATVCVVFDDPCSATFGEQIRSTMLRAIGLLLALLTPIAVGAIVYAGYLYITSTGQEDRAAQAKRVLLYTTLGIAITIAAAIIVNVVVRLFI